MREGFLYTGEHTREISFPLGGIGSGCIGLAGNGRLVDWEIFNRPAKGSTNGFSHFAVKAEEDDRVLDARVLHGDLPPPYTGSFTKPHYNYHGFGPPREYLCGVPHFSEVEFKGEFPIATLSFRDNHFPGDVQLSAFNPFIPLDSDNSSIPAAFFEITIQNTSNKDLTYTVCSCLRNPFPKGETVNRYVRSDGKSLIRLSSGLYGEQDPRFGDLSVATDADDASYQEYLYRGFWFDNLSAYWRELNTPGHFKNRTYGLKQTSAVKHAAKHATNDYGLLAAHLKVDRGETGSVRFVIAWNYPNCVNFWNTEGEAGNEAGPEGACSEPGCCGTELESWKNYYATLFEDSTKTALYSLEKWDTLYSKTSLFKQTLFSSTLPPEVIDAVSANISILKSPTVLRLEHGGLYGWEGCYPDIGCCEGSCSHVWNYEYAVPFLFPDLERSMRDIDFKHNSAEDGSVSFRLQLPLGRKRLDFRPCADGQMGGIIQAYREWKISGNSDWLRSHWDFIKTSLEYAWSDKNRDRWDRDRDGVMEGRQHHTLDMELFGPNAWLTGYYLVALKAAAEMAEHFGEAEKAREYRTLFERGSQWVNENLFNGEYFFQKIDLKDRKILESYSDEGSWGAYRGGRSRAENYWDSENEEIKYQVAEGCGIDQVIGQWHANLCGLGEIFDREKTKKALASIFRYNFKRSMREFFNPCRVFSVNDEGGVVICDYPGSKPAVPAPYAEEAMIGFEYQAACHMIQEGMIEEGLEIVRAIRDRFDGEKRNPWNEFECGSNYARSMASYALLPTLSGFEFDMVTGRVGFAPLMNQDHFDCFWCLNKAWGRVSRTARGAILTVLHGELTLRQFRYELPDGVAIRTVHIDDGEIGFSAKDGEIEFESSVTIAEGSSLYINKD